mmetsp:Transcript_137456/g.342896  ORF Transcript_137456/g.342896 Transcript_137456/m.342896 type:complete len:156 (+) Transcript_137456:114-581(+)|eukprot:CAMPEP_0115252604 /NCGR_PEP_ID=MMETSP0270-20121206/44229_1 /TAXON_ID=71861 /ORGANISM="Scrippsiella trochoidea, Strain CCMP3099" /LENGTH=155 /DNA_ID=CAMNT_0002668057 /DNA_START=109 /DNA_END=576 /DNA_ORIENTATION=+
MGAACCSGDDSGEKIVNSEVKACEEPESADQDFPGMQAPPAVAATAQAPEGSPPRVEAPARAPQEEAYATRLVIEFLLPDGTKESKAFVRRPLGLDFNKSNPITMKRIQPGTHGEELGVQLGWQVVGVNGEDVATKEFDYTYNRLRLLSTQLPQS